MRKLPRMHCVFQRDGMMGTEKDQGAINLSTAGKDTDQDGPVTNGDISKATTEHDNTSQVRG